MRPSQRFWAVLTLMAISACGDSATTGPEMDQGPAAASIPITLNSAGLLSTLALEVTAADFESPLVFNLDLVDGSVTDTLEVPAGASRTFTARGYDAGGVESHRGSITTSLVEGANPAITIRLDPLIGQQPIVIVLGTVTIEVTPAVDTLLAGETAQFDATVLNEAGDTLDVDPTWATVNPAIAKVDRMGLVTGVASGETMLVASIGGSAATATLAVRPVTFPADGLVHFYPFNGNAQDQGSGGADGTVLGPILTADRAGTANAAYQFDGLDDRIDLSAPFFGGSTDVREFTMSVWINLDQLPATGVNATISSKEGFWRTKYLLVLEDGAFRYGGSEPDPQDYIGLNSPPSVLVPGQWHHLAATFSDSVLTLYLDGQPVASVSLSYSSLNYDWLASGNSTDTNIIGAAIPATGAQDFFDGAIDDMALWNRALNPLEIEYLATH